MRPDACRSAVPELSQHTDELNILLGYTEIRCSRLSVRISDPKIQDGTFRNTAASDSSHKTAKAGMTFFESAKSILKFQDL